MKGAGQKGKPLIKPTGSIDIVLLLKQLLLKCQPNVGNYIQYMDPMDKTMVILAVVTVSGFG